ncbi:DUF6879 family protein [Streptomyces pristinaespiralis]|uniref:DUF6879 family protein n=1 Tax=Streptomyces pristinaespiralis TaxID=38300 RepID=UPI0034039EBC
MLISSAERNQLLDSLARDAFHLELRDDYSVPNEEGPFANWQRGEPDDLECSRRRTRSAACSAAARAEA